MPCMPSDICVISSKCGWYMMRAVLAQRELVLERLPWRDGLLRQPRHTVHAVGQQDAVPVDGSWARAGDW